MGSVEEAKATEANAEAGSKERSTVEFPYTDLDNAVEITRGVHSAGGTTCEYDQLAAQLSLEAKGGGFRMRVLGAKAYGFLTYERGGRITLTELGKRVNDPQQEKAARVDAFLTVPLYVKVYEQFRGGPLPPTAGLDRAIVTLGVGQKVKEKARQVLMRSAKQAGFFEMSTDRLTKPAIRQDPPPRGEDLPPKDRKNGNGDGGDGDDNLHPLIRGLLMTLPIKSDPWPVADRLNWLIMANHIFKAIYPTTETDTEIEIKMKKTNDIA